MDKSCQTSETCAERNTSLLGKKLQRAQWLRAAILGANDGLLSTTLLMLGVGAAQEDKRSTVLSGIAGALAGAFSMTVGEFVSVSTQRDIEKTTTKSADQDASPDVKIVIAADTTTNSDKGTTRTQDSEMSPSVIIQTNSISPTGNIHVVKLPASRQDDSSPISEVIDNARPEVLPNPYKAAAASGLAFLCGSIVPILPAVFIDQNKIRVMAIGIVSSIALALFGGVGAYLGGSPIRISAVRVMVGGWIAMAMTYSLLKLFDDDDGNKRISIA